MKPLESELGEEVAHADAHVSMDGAHTTYTWQRT